VYLSLVPVVPGTASESGFSRRRVEEVRSSQSYDGFQLAPLAHTDQVNIRLNRLAERIKRHVHPHTDHFLYIITGQIELTVGDDTHVIGAGEFVSIPHGLPHAMQRLGESEALFLDVAAPPDIGDVIWQE
jgi:quercetin dioxygenase-like cupin family protein